MTHHYIDIKLIAFPLLVAPLIALEATMVHCMYYDREISLLVVLSPLLLWYTKKKGCLAMHWGMK